MEGQIWRYQTRPGEEASRLFIARIDHGLSSQPIYHIYLDGLKLRNPLMAGGVQETLPFAPVSREALEASVRSEEHTSELQSLMRISYAVFCLKKKTRHQTQSAHTS